VSEAGDQGAAREGDGDVRRARSGTALDADIGTGNEPDRDEYPNNTRGLADQRRAPLPAQLPRDKLGKGARPPRFARRAGVVHRLSLSVMSYRASMGLANKLRSVIQAIPLVDRRARGLSPRRLARSEEPRGAGKHDTQQLSAWEAALCSANAPRNQILAAWGHRANVVIADGVEYSGFIQAVIGLNAR